MGRISTVDLGAEIERIADAPRIELLDRWAKAYGQPPPKGISRRLLEYAAAYQIQVKALGGLKQATKRKLQRIAGSSGELQIPPEKPAPRKSLAPGTRLVRDWQGRSHSVDVTEDGFTYDGAHYRSLSHIARTITGARWSGPRFFGI